jgi:hypothetical protein
LRKIIDLRLLFHDGTVVYWSYIVSFKLQVVVLLRCLDQNSFGLAGGLVEEWSGIIGCSLDVGDLRTNASSSLRVEDAPHFLLLLRLTDGKGGLKALNDLLVPLIFFLALVTWCIGSIRRRLITLATAALQALEERKSTEHPGRGNCLHRRGRLARG